MNRQEAQSAQNEKNARSKLLWMVPLFLGATLLVSNNARATVFSVQIESAAEILFDNNGFDVPSLIDPLGNPFGIGDTISLNFNIDSTGPDISDPSFPEVSEFSGSAITNCSVSFGVGAGANCTGQVIVVGNNFGGDFVDVVFNLDGVTDPDGFGSSAFLFDFTETGLNDTSLDGALRAMESGSFPGEFDPGLFDGGFSMAVDGGRVESLFISSVLVSEEGGGPAPIPDPVEFVNPGPNTIELTGPTTVTGEATNDGVVSISPRFDENQNALNHPSLEILSTGQLTNNGEITNGVGTTNDGLPLVPGETVTNSGILNNEGTLRNESIFNNDGGTINNNQTIRNGGPLSSEGDRLAELNNNDGTINNNGTFDNSSGILDNGSIDFRDSSVFNNNFGAIITNDNGLIRNSFGTFNNAGIIENENGVIISSGRGTVFNNDGSINVSTGELLNFFGSTFTNNGSITSTGQRGTSNGDMLNSGIWHNNGTLIADGGFENFNLADVVGQGVFNNNDGALLGITAGFFSVRENSFLHNRAGATIEIRENTADPFNEGTLLVSAGELNNDGTIDSTGTILIRNDGVLNNSGTISNDGPGFFLVGTRGFGSVQNGTVNNDGVILSNSGFLEVSVDGTVNGTGQIVQTGGLFTVDGAITQSTVRIEGGTLSGSGSITGNVIVDGGTVAPGNSPGTFTIIGDLTFNTGTFELEIDSDGNSDLFDVSGDVFFGADAIISLFLGSIPSDDFDIAQFFTGFTSFEIAAGFDLVNNITVAFLDDTVLPDGAPLRLAFGDDALLFTGGNDTPVLESDAQNPGNGTQVPEPGTLFLLGVGLLGLGYARRRRRAA